MSYNMPESIAQLKPPHIDTVEDIIAAAEAEGASDYEFHGATRSQLYRSYYQGCSDPDCGGCE